MLEITDLGWLSLAALLGGLLLGGQPSLIGFSLSLEPEQRVAYLTPIVHVALAPERPGILPSGTAITLGGTIVHALLSPEARWKLLNPESEGFYPGATWNEMVLNYELGHIPCYTGWGLGCIGEILRDPCQHDPGLTLSGLPRSIWGVCPSYHRPGWRQVPLPSTGSLKISW